MYSYDTLKYLFFIVERISRTQKIRNIETVKHLGLEGLQDILTYADILHCDNHDATAHSFIVDYNIPAGDFDITATKASFQPIETEIGRVYARVFEDVYPNGGPQEVINLYASPIAEIVDDYATKAFCESTACLACAFERGHF